MKKRLLALALILCLGLSGCAALLNREYSSSTPHADYPVSEKTALLQAENYRGLVNAILYFITEHEESGIVHLTYAQELQQVTDDLDAACQEVRAEDPLGAYAVEDIEYSAQHITSYYEVTVSITYAHTMEEVAAIVSVAGSSSIRQPVSAAMSTFADKCVFRVSYFTGDDSSLRQLVRQTWLDTPLAVDKPRVGITLYPSSGTSRIIEVTLGWPHDTALLTEQSSALEKRALELLEQSNLSPEDSDDLTLEALLTVLKQAAEYDPEGKSTAYAVLVEGQGDTLGFTRALRLLCQLTDLEATVVEGRLNGGQRFWLIVNTPEGYRHLDPTLSQPEYATDDAFTEAGYTWDAGRYPSCVEYTPPAEPDPEQTEEGGEPREGGEPGEEGEPADRGEPKKDGKTE